MSEPVAWETVAEEALGVMKVAADVAAKKAADDIYARILDTAQDYLEENLRFNIASTLATAERERRAAQDRVGGLLALIGEQHAALKGLARDARPSNWDDDDDPEHVAAWLAADAAIAKAEARQ